MDYDKIAGIALAEMQNRVSMKSEADINKLQEAISAAIAKALEEYDRQKAN